MRGMNPKHSILMLALVAFSGCVFAQAKDKDAGNPNQWLSKEQEAALSDSVPPPPAPGSTEDQADLAKILEAQKARTPEIVAECKLDQTFSYKLFKSVYGSSLTPESSPKFHELMDDVLAATKVVNEAAKINTSD